MDVFEGETASADDIVAASNTLPFMSERRLVVVHSADRIGSDGMATLAAYVEDPSPATVLVLSAAKTDRRTRLFKAAERSGTVAEYAAPRRSDYARLVAGVFTERGGSVSLAGAQIVVDVVGYDLRRLSSEIDKVVAFSAGATLSDDEIVAVVAKTAPVSVFTAMDSIGSRDLPSALRAVRELIGQGESPLRLAMMATRHVRNLLRVKALTERGAHPGETQRLMRMRDWQVRNLATQARRFETRELVSALRSAAHTEAEMKTSPVDPGLVLERWIAAACGVTPSRRPTS